MDKLNEKYLKVVDDMVDMASGVSEAEAMALIDAYTFKAVLSCNQKLDEMNKTSGSTSDGYHTFDELYMHRHMLWINLCLLNKDCCYVIEDHYKNWFLLCMNSAFGQVSYHCPNSLLQFVEGIERKKDHEFDGHTSDDVVRRLGKIAISMRDD